MRPRTIRVTAAAAVLLLSPVAYAAGAALAQPRFPSFPPPAPTEVVDHDPDGPSYYLADVAGGKPGDPEPLAGVPGIESATWVSDGVASVASRLTADQLAAVPGVDRVEAEVIGHASGDDPFVRYQWALDNSGQTGGAVGADVKWRWARTATTASGAAVTGAGVVVAVIDSGADLDHPELVRAWQRNPNERCGDRDDDDRNGYVDDCLGWDFVDNDATVDGGANGHGTAVAGVIAASPSNGVGVAGVAPGARVLPIRIFDDGSGFPMSRAALAVDYAVAEGADVINASWGSPPGAPSQRPLQRAIARAEAAGVMVVAAAGNEGVDISRVRRYPASYWTALAVGATNYLDKPTSSSNRGARTIDVHAPGAGVLTTWSGGRYAYANGTSMAAPHAAAAAALFLHANPDAPPGLVRRVLRTSARPLTSLRGLSETGARLDVAALLDVTSGAADNALAVSFERLFPYAPRQQHEWVVHVRGASTSAMPAGPIDVTATLGFVYRGQAWAVAGLPVTVVGQQFHTNPTGTFPLARATTANAIAAGVDVPVSAMLPAGEYVVMVEVRRAGSPSSPPLGGSHVAAFVVAKRSSTVSPAPSPTPTAAPSDPGATVSPVPSMPAPDDPASPSPGTTTPPGPDPSSSPQPSSGPDGEATASPDPDPSGTVAPDDGGSQPAPTPEPTTATPEPTAATPEPTAATPEPTAAPSEPTGPEATVTPTPTPSSSEPTDEPDGLRDGPVVPNRGRTSGGTDVHIRGVDFGTGETSGLAAAFSSLFGTSETAHPEVRFGGVTGDVIAFDEDEDIVRVTSPPHPAGTVDVVVSDPATGETLTYPASFTYSDDPVTPPVDGEPSPSSSPQPTPTTAPPQPRNGLTLAAPADGSALAALNATMLADARCTTATCAAQRM